MKLKALRYKKEHNPFQEFVVLEDIGEGIEVFTSSTPKLYPESSTLEGLIQHVEENDYFEGLELDWDTVEMVEFELVEENTIGADIRNKLTPNLNLINLLELYFKETDIMEQVILKKYIDIEMKKTKENIKYISNLL